MKAMAHMVNILRGSGGSSTCQRIHCIQTTRGREWLQWV